MHLFVPLPTLFLCIIFIILPTPIQSLHVTFCVARLPIDFLCFSIFLLLFAQEYYKKLATSTTQIESHLSNKLAEFLNAEIVLNTITDAEASMERWFRTTFLYARTAKRKPTNQADADLKSTYFFKIFFFSLIEFLFESTNLTLGSQFQAHTKK